MKTFPLFFIVYFFATFIFVGILLFIEGTPFLDIIHSLLYLNQSDYFSIIGFFLIYISLYLVIYLVKIRKSAIGEHTLSIEGENFVWRGNNQEVRTSFKRVKKLIITKKYFSLKFDGIKKATVYKIWSLEGFKDFTQELKEKVKEFNGKVVEK